MARKSEGAPSVGKGDGFLEMMTCSLKNTQVPKPAALYINNNLTISTFSPSVCYHKLTIK
jgi:hypothetical protein